MAENVDHYRNAINDSHYAGVYNELIADTNEWNVTFGEPRLTGTEKNQIGETFYNGFVNEHISADDRMDARAELKDMLDAFGIDFDEIFDWEAWREAYGND